jgi:hypothetical protein
LLHLSPTSAQPKGPGARPARTLPSAPFSSGAAEKRRIAAAAAAAAAAVRLLQPRTGLAALPPLPPACASQLKAPPSLLPAPRLRLSFPLRPIPPLSFAFFLRSTRPSLGSISLRRRQGGHPLLPLVFSSVDHLWPFVGAPATNTRQVRPRIPFALPFSCGGAESNPQTLMYATLIWI